ncbi:hypothetical protein BH11MYX1_BH11MYX1_47560 [soil metagenome]
MRGLVLGVLLALANTIVIAIGIAAAKAGDPVENTTLVCVIGGMPALLAGLAVGVLAHATRSAAPWARRIWLSVPALGCVLALGAWMGELHFVGVACIPTSVAVMILERRTRAVREPEVARAVVC